ncbi:MAG: 4-phosphopantetheinyl transferase family protein [Tissierellaceae bacterium]|nr:4-phosphopantetheinyl transferase family protein [Tissierellaceae bacterium]
MQKTPLGIDIEAVKCIEYKDIAQNFFTEREFNYIVKQESDIQLSKFYEIWTLKESYMKCTGKGFSILLKSFSVYMDEYEDIRVIDDNQNENCIFKIFDISMDYKMAVCSLNREISDNIIVIDQNSLINNYFDLFQGDEVYNGNQ